MQWMASSVLCVTLCPVRAPRRFAGSAFLPVEPVEWFHPRSLPGPVFVNVGRQALPHQGWVCGQSVLLLDGLPVEAIELHLPGF